VATSTCEPEYMALALATKQWIWLTNALEELNVLVTNAAMYYYNKATIDIASNAKRGDRSKHIDIAYHLVRGNVESGPISLLQVELAENLADICTTGLPHVTYRNFGLQLWMQNMPECRFWRIFSYVVIHCEFSCFIS
jgi:hypothetical protein